MRVLLIGSGGRENAMADALLRGGAELYAFMGIKNPGIARAAKAFETGPITEIKSIRRYAEANKIELAVVGPEAPLGAGVVDELNSAGIKCFGPSKKLAQLETSKSFLRKLLEKHKISASPMFRIYSSYDANDIKKTMEEFGQWVIKPDGLTGGKGVKVLGDHLQGKEDSLQYCEEVLKEHKALVIEEKLEGEEFSLQTIADGTTAFDCPAVQDHKRAFENDQGQNTGGMGSYSDSNHRLPFLTQEDIEQAHEITVRVMRALKKETGSYKGIMYGGFMATKKGVKVIEYNARFGDPEAMNVLPIMKTNFAKLCDATANEELGRIKVEFERKATVCKYVVPEGYPENPKICEIKVEPHQSALTYYASVEENGKSITTTKSRAIALVGIADTIEEAEQISESAARNVKGKVYHRKDIGTSKLLEKRIENMRRIRNG